MNAHQSLDIVLVSNGYSKSVAAGLAYRTFSPTAGRTYWVELTSSATQVDGKVFGPYPLVEAVTYAERAEHATSPFMALQELEQQEAVLGNGWTGFLATL